MGGSSYEVWQEYVEGFNPPNRAQLEQELANADNNLRTNVCNAVRKLRDAVKNCIRDCPEYAPLGPAMDAWVASQGC
jgi:hypothetical protein